jgi:hypothetical protein
MTHSIVRFSDPRSHTVSRPFYTIFHLYSVGQFDWKRKPEDPEKTTDLSQITEKRYVAHLALFEIRTHIISGDRALNTINQKIQPIRPLSSHTMFKLFDILQS